MALSGVSVRFPRRAEPALREVSLDVGPGEHVVLLGPSGSGKSTVLQVLTGVVPHSVTAQVTGEVSVRGTGADVPVVQRARHLGVVAQDPTAGVCLPSVEQELALPMENHGADPATIDARIAEALDVVGAGHLRARSTASLSGGETQRVALAAALVTEPEVLLLDEPTSMLDPAGIEAVRGAVRAATERYSPAVVLVEHRLDEWAGEHGTGALPARALALDGAGRILATGDTVEVLRAHARELVAEGCWLPLDAELFALTGSEGGLGSATNAALLRDLAADAAPPPATEGDPVLTARDLAVGRPLRRPRRKDGAQLAEAQVLAGLDLTVRAGEVIAVLGANGIGKSTLLLTLARLLPPLHGEVAGAPPGLVFQNAEHQFLAHTVAGEIGHGLDEGSRGPVVERMLRRHRLVHLAEQNPFRLSGGEKRRLSLAAMLAHDPPVLLADEPTLGLDRHDSVATVATLRAEAAAGRGVVVTSHDVRTVASLADRVVLLADGGVVADGRTHEVLGDAGLTSRSGIRVPELVAWLLASVPGPAVGHVLRRLDEAAA